MGAALLLPVAIIGGIVGVTAVGTIIGLTVHVIKLKKQKNALEESIAKEKAEMKRLRKVTNMRNMTDQLLLSNLVNKNERRESLLAHEISYLDYNFCFMGRSGVGKSALINGIIRKDVATECLRECKAELKKYDVPFVNFIKLWDCPGYGTDRFPFEDYKDTLVRFDFIFIVMNNRIHSWDLDLLKTANKHLIPVALIRSRSDQDVDNLANSKFRKSTFSQLNENQKKLVKTECWKTVDDDIGTKLLENGLDDIIKYYYVSSRVLKNGDSLHPKFDEDKLFNETLQIAADNKANFEEKLMKIFSPNETKSLLSDDA